MKTSDAQDRVSRFPRISAWIGGTVLLLSILGFAGAGVASAQTGGGLASQATCPTDPYTGATTLCNTGNTGNTATTVANTGSNNVPTASPSPNSGSGGALATTGADILMGILAAVLLILLGTTVTLAARQRRHAL